MVSPVHAHGANYSGTLLVLYVPAEPTILVLCQSCTCPRSQLFWYFFSLVHARGAINSGTLPVLYMSSGASYSGSLSVLYMRAEPTILVLCQSYTCPSEPTIIRANYSNSMLLLLLLQTLRGFACSINIFVIILVLVIPKQALALGVLVVLIGAEAVDGIRRKVVHCSFS
jgi:hypothetical protein